jgi:bifunctional DNA-binding transcriptional regulator/antitoxin component of YhaV-PrlF toxin-antitoxin module
MEDDTMELKKVTIHKVKDSFMVYLPITWGREMNLQKGDQVIWYIEEGDFERIHLKKEKGVK